MHAPDSIHTESLHTPHDHEKVVPESDGQFSDDDLCIKSSEAA